MWQAGVGICGDIREFDARRLEQDANPIDERRL
jgi:hypothetical protein